VDVGVDVLSKLPRHRWEALIVHSYPNSISNSNSSNNISDSYFSNDDTMTSNIYTVGQHDVGWGGPPKDDSL
jgi:hypothetical protein